MSGSRGTRVGCASGAGSGGLTRPEWKPSTLKHSQSSSSRPAHSRRTHSQAGRSLRLVLLAIAPLLAACGGGGGGAPPPPEAEAVIAGLAGSIMLPDFDLGRVVEQEPNDGPAQAFQLAPVWPRSTLEVTGTLAETAARYGLVDGVDVLRVQSCVDQRLSLELVFEPDDPLALRANDLSATVFEVETGFELGTLQGGAQPLTFAFDATAYVRYDVRLSLAAGHAWYTLRFVGSDALQPDPLLVPLMGAGTAGGAQRDGASGALAKPSLTSVGGAACARGPQLGPATSRVRVCRPGGRTRRDPGVGPGSAFGSRPPGPWR